MLVARHRQAGDTIIEVLSAIVVFSSLAVGTIAIMNQGLNNAQHSLEVTQVRQQIDAQAETLRYINQAYVVAIGNADAGNISTGVAGEWGKLRTIAQNTSTLTATITGGQSCPEIKNEAFVLDSHGMNIWDQKPKQGDSGLAPAYAQLLYDPIGYAGLQDAYGIWVEAIDGDTGNDVNYIDFHIQACWNGAGGGSVSTLGTIVRLYDPKV